MDLLNKLTIKNLKLNKKRSIVTIIGILLSVALITALSSLYSSFISSAIKYETSVKGNYHYEFMNVNKDDVKTIENNSKIKELGLVNNLGYAELKESKNEFKPYVYVKAYNKVALNNILGRLIEGRLPENENEIIISEHIRKNGNVNIKVGDTITLDIGKRTSEGMELTQDTPFNEENNEKIEDTTTKQYKVVGIAERPGTYIESYEAPGYTVITYLDNIENTTKLDVFAVYTKQGVKEYIDITSNILEVDKKVFKMKYDNTLHNSHENYEIYTKAIANAKYKYQDNQYLIQLQTNPLSISTIQGLGGIVTVVLVIIIVTSVFCIKNSFDISITEKTKQYGMLKSIGATKKQIKKNVLFEATILGVIGIPLGILCGLLATFMLVHITNVLALNENNGLRLIFSVSFIAILVSILLGIVTIYLSAVRSAKRASKVSPIDSIRNSANIKINNKKLKTPRYIKSLFGVGGVIALKNTKRNKKRYRTAIISLTISIATFIALFSFTSLVKKESQNQFRSTKANLIYTINDYYEDHNLVEQTINLDNIKDYSIYRKSAFTLKNPKYSDYYIKRSPELADSSKNEDITISFVALNDSAYRKYLKELGLNYNDTVDKAIMIDSVSKMSDDGNSSNEKTQRYGYQTGSVINGIIYSTEYNNDKGRTDSEEHNLSIEIAKVTSEYPVGGDNQSSYLIVSDKFLEKNNIKIAFTTVNFDSSNAEKLQEEIESIFGNKIQSIINIEKDKQREDNVLLLINIFLYGFITVISLIGITNIFNTITTSMELRKQEFAMLKSIGMTKKEFRKMINLESIFIGSKSLIYGSIIGTILAYIIYLLDQSDRAFDFPTVAILICVIVVFLLITTLMKYAIGKINKQNTIETIRNENI